MIEMGTPKERWLAEYSKKSTKKRHSKYFDDFCEWAQTSDKKLVKEYKASNPREFAKRWGRRIVQYYNWLIENGAKTNTARTKIIAPRAFLKSQAVEVKIKRGAIARAKMAMGEHEFRLEEFQKMYRVGNIEEKARLATAICLGWGAGDFRKLERSFIEPFLDENLEPPVAFWYERGKTGAPSRSHLTHEAIEALRDWLRVASKGRYVFSGRNGNPLKVGSLNKWLKSLARRAKIEKRGKIRFHLLRKFTLSQLSASGMNQWEAKLCTGKMIPSDILTYLKDQTENLRKKFMLAESRLTLTGLTNSHYGKIGEISTKMKELKSILTKQQKEMREQTLKIDVLTDSLTKQEQINRNFTDLFNGLIEEGLRPKIEKVSRKKGIEIFGELKNLHAKTVKLIEGKPEKRKEGHYQY